MQAIYIFSTFIVRALDEYLNKFKLSKRPPSFLLFPFIFLNLLMCDIRLTENRKHSIKFNSSLGVVHKTGLSWECAHIAHLNEFPFLAKEMKYGIRWTISLVRHSFNITIRLASSRDDIFW